MKLIEQNPSSVLIEGALINEDCSMEPFDGGVKDIRYGTAVLVTHRGKNYTIRRTLSGGIEVI